MRGLPRVARRSGGLEPDARAGNLRVMDPSRRPATPPVLDMTPDGEFRDSAASAGLPQGWLDRALARVGGIALLLTLAAGGFVVAALAILFVGLLLPVVIAAGAVAFGTLWWRLRRLRARGGVAGGGPSGQPGSGVRFVVIRR